MGAALIAALAAPTTAHQGEPHQSVPLAPAMTPIEVRALDYFTDTVVVDHEGKERRFFTDMLRGKTVAVTFFYSDCEGACPIMNAMMSGVEEKLGPRLGDDIFFISLTVDPDTDTVEKLADYRRNFTDNPGWAFVTGSPEAIEMITERLGNVQEKEAHLTTLLIGDASFGRWRKVNPMAGPAVVAETLKDFADGVYDQPEHGAR